MMNRGVERRQIYMDNADRARFVHDMWEFNDVEDAKNVWHRAPQKADIKGLRNPYMPKDRIVDLHAWCLMGNHYHLLLSERVDGGLTKFIRRLNVGYANYFNERYERKGALFQGRTKKVHIDTDAHFLHILNYIHSNPLDFMKVNKGWRIGSVGDMEGALAHISKYKWSSYLDYAGTANFPSVLTTDLFSSIFKDYKAELRSFIKGQRAKLLADYRLEY